MTNIRLFSLCRRRRLTVICLAILGVALLFYVISYTGVGQSKSSNDRNDIEVNGEGRHLSWKHGRGGHHRRKHHRHMSVDSGVEKVCKVPRLSLSNDALKSKFHPMAPLECPGENLMYMHKAVLHFNHSVQPVSNLLKCDYRAIEWTTDAQHTYSKTLERVKDFEIKIRHDFLRVQCYLKQGNGEQNYHARRLLSHHNVQGIHKMEIRESNAVISNKIHSKTKTGHDNRKNKKRNHHHTAHHPNAFGSMGLPDPPLLISHRSKTARDLREGKDQVTDKHTKGVHVDMIKAHPPKQSRGSISGSDLSERKKYHVLTQEENTMKSVNELPKTIENEQNKDTNIHVLPKRSIVYSTPTAATNTATRDISNTASSIEGATDDQDQLTEDKQTDFREETNEENDDTLNADVDEKDGIVNKMDDNLEKDVEEDKDSNDKNKEQLQYDGHEWLGAPDYDQFIAQIYPQDEVYNRIKEIEVPAESTQMNVLVFVIDALSHLSWQRKLPKTYAYLKNDLDAVIMKGYNVVGDDSPAALIPILTGKFESELPKVSKNAAGSTYIDSFPLVWNQFEQNGYVTLFAEDQPDISAFNLRYNGFEFKPTDHYMRTFWQAVQNSEVHTKSPKYCLGNRPKHKYLLEYIKQFFLKYNNVPRFGFAFHGELSHLDNNPVEHLDTDLSHFLEVLKTTKVLDNTLLIFMSDHGARVGEERGSIQGKLEQRLPMMSFVFPPSFKSKYEDNIKRLKHNAYRLTTPFDLHETLLDLLDTSRLAEPVKYTDRAISLFKEIPLNRTCHSAAICPQWCSCLTWQELKKDIPVVKTVASVLVDKINSILHPAQQLCHSLSLKTVIDAKISLPNEKVMFLGKKVDSKQRLMTFTSDMLSRLEVINYQVIIQTMPNMGVYEATVQYTTKTKTFNVTDDISRLDIYGQQSKCVMDNFASMMKYCHCK